MKNNFQLSSLTFSVVVTALVVVIYGLAFSSVSAQSTTTPSTTGSISGISYNDLDKDNVKDSNESGISGATIKLYGGTFYWSNWNKMSQIATTTTDANGNYIFRNLQDGVYRVKQDKLQNWKQISGNYRWVLVLNGRSLTGLDFANITGVNLSLDDDHEYKNRGQKRKAENMRQKEVRKQEQTDKKVSKLLEKIEKLKNS